MTISVQQNILRLQIPMHNTIGMEVGYSRYNFSGVDTRQLLPSK
jgi:hypothetical protein